MKVVIFISLIYQILAVKTFEKSYSMIVKKNYFHDFDYSDGRIFYATCPRGYFPKKVCWVIGEKSLKRDDVYSCKVTLKTDKKNDNTGPLVFIKNRFGDDKVVMFWQVKNSYADEEYSVISYLQLANCKITDFRLKVRIAPADVFVVSYVNTFDVFFMHNRNMDRITIDNNGQLIRGPIPFIENCGVPYRLLALSESTPDKGFFYIEKDDNDETVYSLIKSDGLRKQLTRVVSEGETVRKVSTSNEFISECVIYNEHIGYINCTQYDITGKQKFDVRLKVDNSAHLLLLHNIRQGGILVAYREKLKCENCEKTVNNYKYLVKLNAEGKKIGNKIEHETSVLDQWNAIFENDNHNYCLLKSSGFIGSIFGFYNLPQIMDVTHECYDDDDF